MSCPYYEENIIVRSYGLDKLIEATGYCTECPQKIMCLKTKYSVEYFEQLREALGFKDSSN